MPEDAPAKDFHGNPWFSRDGERAVIWVSGKPVAMSNATPIGWARYAGIADETP